MNCTLLLPTRHVFQGLLYGLNLLGDSRQHSLLQSVELVKTAPGPNLTKPHKDTTHSL